MHNLLSRALNASIRAGEAILNIYENDFVVDYKLDKSPLTEADKAADKVIHKILGDKIPIISEEMKASPYSDRKDWKLCWLVDPLDGTKEFIKKNGEFTVNIALIEDGIPVLGVVYLPVTKELYIGSRELESCLIKVSPDDDISQVEKKIENARLLKENEFPNVYTVVASRSHMSEETQQFIQSCEIKHGEVNLVSKGSSIKLCLVAARKAHVYPRIAPTMEWDTAAAHAVAKFAGCKVLDYITREELQYNKKNLLNPYFIVTH